MVVEVKCKKCRATLFDNTECPALLINAHGLKYQVEIDQGSCPTITENNLLFLNEEVLPEWIQNNIAEDQWSKGKFNCKHCSARIGAFDFVSGIKCACEQFVLPAVHVIKSKVDVH